MRFLDLDLDFFLNDSACRSGSESGRLSSKYKPWSASRVRHFIEKQCGLSRDTPVPGRTVESHHEVFYFWRTLIESGSLGVPFEVIHIDAHPDMWVGDGLYLVSEVLYVDSQLVLTMLRRKQLHPGNYLTFAIGHGWIASLIWVSLRSQPEGVPGQDEHARLAPTELSKRKDCGSQREVPAVMRDPPIPFKILPWRKFKTEETFDYVALCKSPDFTPPESDELVPIIEEYIKQI